MSSTDTSPDTAPQATDLPLPPGRCPVCAGRLQPGLRDWHFSCAGCAYEASTLQPGLDAETARELIEQVASEPGLRALRQHNFRNVLHSIRHHLPQGGRLLEVGAAQGWFLELAQQDFEASGIEPDRALFDALSYQGLRVSLGQFPQDLGLDATFDIIVFNDVIEQLADISRVIEYCHHHLEPDGLLVLSLPSSDGVLYRLARGLARCGLGQALERLWHKDLPTPHVHYFNRHNLHCLLLRHSFIIEEQGTLQRLSRDGLRARLALGGTLGPLGTAAYYLSLRAVMPFLRWLPGDLIYTVARRP